MRRSAPRACAERGPLSELASEEEEVPEIRELVLQNLVGGSLGEICALFAGQVEVVGDDVVYGAVKEAAKTFGIVDGPDADLLARRVNFRNAGIAHALFLEEENVAV